MKLKIITYATHDEGYINILKKQLDKLNHEYEILGYGKTWKGFFQKYIDVYEYLLTLNDDYICLFTDGFDTIVLENKDIILKKFKSYDKKIVFGIQDYQNKIKKIAQDLVFKKHEGHVINSGTYIGYNKYLKKMFKQILEIYGDNNYKLDDQIIINDFFDKHNKFYQKYVGLDKNILIFANMTNKRSIYYLTGKYDSNYIIKDNSIINENNGNSPSIISGSGNFDLSKYVIFLGYDSSEIIQRQYNKFLMNNVKEYFNTIIDIKSKN